MTKEEKTELIKAICGYLPYGIVCQRPSGNSVITKIYFDKEYNDWVTYNEEGLGGSITFEKPYLRPMSSMTKEERIEFSKLLVKRYCEEDWEGHISTSYCIEIDNVYTDDEDGIKYPTKFSMDAIDWLNAHRFDYRGLIPKGLALPATDGMYN